MGLFVALSYIQPSFLFLYQRASRDEMAAAAGSTAYPKSESQNSGLVGNIHGQDVESAKGVVY